jgi:hypothetical protein
MDTSVCCPEKKQQFPDRSPMEHTILKTFPKREDLTYCKSLYVASGISSISKEMLLSNSFKTVKPILTNNNKFLLCK